MIKKISGLILCFFWVAIVNAQLPLIELEALQALYNATGGPDWISETNGNAADDWVFATPLIDTDVTNWFGVTVNAGHVTQLLLDVNGNTGNNLIGVIPTELGNLTNLIDLDLSDQTALTGPIPISFGNLLNLQFLLLNNNQLTGTIPPVLGDLSNLETLWLSANELNGTIPPSLGNLGNLESLLLSENDLTGSIPTELGNLSSLVTLQISFTNISGEIPSELGMLSNLNSLSLRFNNLTGEIPETIYDLNNLTFLLLENNQLEGTISSRIGDLMLLENLSLRDNQFEGNIPEEIGAISTLTTLFLSYNNFTGAIPDSFSGLVNLGVFLANDNDIEGVLPPGLISWTNLSSIDIMNNRIEGDIPSFVFLNPVVFRIYGNRFQFGDFEDEFSYYESFSLFVDNPQALVNDIDNVTGCVDGSITLNTTVSGSANVYEWFKDGVAIASSNTPNLVISNLQIEDSGVYTCEISSAIVTDLVLERNPITLTVSSNGPTAYDIDDVVICDTDTDGFATFNLDLVAIESQITGSQNGLTVSYFDAVGAPIVLTNSFTNTTANQQDITVRVAASPTCFDEAIFSLIVNPAAVADVFSNAVACVADGFILPNLSANNSFYTEPNKTGTLLNEGDLINESQIIYVFAETGTGSNSCTDETSFTVTINGVLADDLEDVKVCESYILPNLTAGNNYYSLPNGTGTVLNAGDEITATQTLYINNNDGSCSSETNFLVEVLGLPTADVFQDVEACNFHILPALSIGNTYFTASNGLGTLLNEGHEIVESQTIYVYAESASGDAVCFDESNFNVNINEVSVSELEDVIACLTYTLPILPEGQDYYTEADGNGRLLLAGNEVLESMVVFVYTQVNGCSGQSSFSVNIDPVACRDIESLGLPKFFTPNNDSYNDVWDISKLSGTGDIGIFIYDRFGKLLKQLNPNSSNSNWDGFYNGKAMPSSDYWFQYVNKDTGIRLSGHFSLKR